MSVSGYGRGEQDVWPSGGAVHGCPWYSMACFQGRTFKFCVGGGCRHVLDRLDFFGPTGRIQAVRALKEL